MRHLKKILFGGALIAALAVGWPSFKKSNLYLNLVLSNRLNQTEIETIILVSDSGGAPSAWAMDVPKDSQLTLENRRRSIVAGQIWGQYREFPTHLGIKLYFRLPELNIVRKAEKLDEYGDKNFISLEFNGDKASVAYPPIDQYKKYIEGSCSRVASHPGNLVEYGPLTSGSPPDYQKSVCANEPPKKELVSAGDLTSFTVADDAGKIVGAYTCGTKPTANLNGCRGEFIFPNGYFAWVQLPYASRKEMGTIYHQVTKLLDQMTVCNG